MKIEARFIAPERQASTPEELAGILASPLWGALTRLTTSNDAFTHGDVVKLHASNGRRTVTAWMDRAEWARFSRIWYTQ